MTWRNTVREDGGSPNFWAINVLAIMNLVIVIIRLARLKDHDALLPLIALLMLVFVIWTASMTLRKLLLEVSAQLDAPHLQRLRVNASTIGIAANAAIACSLPFVR